jgi:hypothetical protein
MVLILKRDPNADDDEFYLVHHRGKVVGRIFNRRPGAHASSDATWFWCLAYDPRWQHPFSGDAASQKAAITTFRARWDAGPAPKKA